MLLESVDKVSSSISTIYHIVFLTRVLFVNNVPVILSFAGAESKQKFAQELGLDFSILADEGDAVRKLFSVPKALFGAFPGRVTYVLDKDGVCTTVYDNLGDAASHIGKAKEALAEIAPAASGKKVFGLF